MVEGRSIACGSRLVAWENVLCCRCVRVVFVGKVCGCKCGFRYGCVCVCVCECRSQFCQFVARKWCVRIGGSVIGCEKCQMSKWKKNVSQNFCV